MPQRDTTFGEYVFQVRQSKGWSLREAAKHVGITHSRLDEIEKMIDNRSGKRHMPSYKNVVRLAKAYELPIADLLPRAGYETGQELDAYERRLVDAYRNLAEPQRTRLAEFLDELEKSR
jgi:transcriptional regulator with XRE-family HTH domain